jgi:MFS family permease
METPTKLAAARGVYYGWVIVALSWINQAIGHAAWYSFPLFFVALIQQFGWDRGETAFVFSVFLVVGALAGPPVGLLVDRFGPRTVLAMGAALMAAGLAICAVLDQLWQFYLAYGVLAGLGMTAIGWIGNNAVVSRWFVRRQGAATGIASTGVGVGISFLIPLIQGVIQQYGWRPAYLALALGLAMLVPLNVLLQRANPRTIGLEPDGDLPGQAPTTSRTRLVVLDKAWAARTWTLRTAVRTKRFWLLFLGFGAATFAQQLLIVHQVAFLVDANRPASALDVASRFGLMSIFTKVILGWASDRYGREVTFTVGTVLYILAFPLLGVTARQPDGAPILWLYALLVGVGLGTIGPIAPGMAADIFAGPRFGLIFGTIVISTGLCGALGAWFAGWAFDLTHTYVESFVAAIAAAGLAVVCCWLAAPRKVRRVAAGGGA